MSDDDKNIPPKVKPRLKSAPKIRELYWCDFPKDAQLPELWKTRPVVILSKTATLYGSVVVVPCSTEPEQDPKYTVQIQTTFDAKTTWVICDKPTTVAVSRLTSDKSGIKRLPMDEFNAVLAKVLGLLPTPI